MNLRTITTLGVLLAACRSGPEPTDESALRAQARRVHADAIVIDTHSDTTPKFENAAWDFNFATGYIDPKKSALAARLRPEVEEIYARYPDDPREARKQRIALYAEHDPGPTPASVVIDHIEHVLTLVGEDHVGLGADWDGVPELPVGLDDCSKLETVTLELLRRGWSEDAVTKVLGGNLLRVMEEVEATGARLRREGGAR